MTILSVARPGTVISREVAERVPEAVALAPDGWVGTPEEMLPQEPWRGRCRICGDLKFLDTREHIPPREAGNKGQYRGFAFEDWLNRADPDNLNLGGGSPGQGGTWAYTLCADCNNITGVRYGREYKAWAARAIEIMKQLPITHHDRDQCVEDFGVGFRFGGLQDGGVAPGAFVRQVLSCMCTVGGGWKLTERHPEIRDIILDRAQLPLPSDLRLSMVWCWGPRSRYTGPLLMVDTETGEWKWIMELAFPPFAFSMVLASSHEFVPRGVDIGGLTSIDPHRLVSYEVAEPGVLLGFTWSPYPMDYRSTAAMSRDRAPAKSS